MIIDNFKLKSYCFDNGIDKGLTLFAHYKNPIFNNLTVNTFKFKFLDSELFFSFSFSNSSDSALSYIENTISSEELQFKKLQSIHFRKSHEDYLLNKFFLIYVCDLDSFHALQTDDVRKVIKFRIKELIKKHKGNFTKTYNDFLNDSYLIDFVNSQIKNI